MTSKNDLGSMLLADEKSVPVFFKDCMAARTACTIATADTNEKTKQDIRRYPGMPRVMLTDNFSSHFFGLLTSEGRCQTTRNNVYEDLRSELVGGSEKVLIVLTGLGASAATVDRRSSSVLTPSMKQTSAPASAASLRRVIASSIPRTCAESVRPMITCRVI